MSEILIGQLPRRAMWVKARTINRLAARDGGRRCFYCHADLDPVPGPFPLLHIHIDHARPRAKGGSNRQANKVIACEPCNRAKTDLDFDVFLCERRA